jgi:hypothetical protein
MNVWEAIFRQSRVNGGTYDEQSLPQRKWDWPTETWFQTRLERLREVQARIALRPVRNGRRTDELRTM